jgi:hypothetical protein
MATSVIKRFELKQHLNKVDMISFNLKAFQQAINL